MGLPEIVAAGELAGALRGLEWEGDDIRRGGWKK
jgi:hypothetical protein